MIYRCLQIKMKAFIKDLKQYWRIGTWVGKRLPLLFACYALLYLPFLLADTFLNFIPKRILQINMAFMLFTSFYCGCCMLYARRNLKFERRKLIEVTIEILKPKLIYLAEILDYNCRPSVVTISNVAQILVACKRFKITGCDTEIAFLEAWVRFWDEEKVVTIK